MKDECCLVKTCLFFFSILVFLVQIIHKSTFDDWRWCFVLPGCVVTGPPPARADAAMPFGCLTLGEKKDYNSPSEVTDKYDLGQIVKTWVRPCDLPSPCPCGTVTCAFFLHREEFCEIFRAKDRNTLKMYTCKKFHKKDGRKVRKAAKNEIMILKM